MHWDRRCRRATYAWWHRGRVDRLEWARRGGGRHDRRRAVCRGRLLHVLGRGRWAWLRHPDSAHDGRILSFLQALPGFDNKAFFQAMTSPDNARFVYGRGRLPSDPISQAGLARSAPRESRWDGLLHEALHNPPESTPRAWRATSAALGLFW